MPRPDQTSRKDETLVETTTAPMDHEERRAFAHDGIFRGAEATSDYGAASEDACTSTLKIGIESPPCRSATGRGG
jgi:hypothetical protein